MTNMKRLIQGFSQDLNVNAPERINNVVKKKAIPVTGRGGL
jgi:hypothetical protein